MANGFLDHPAAAESPSASFLLYQAYAWLLTGSRKHLELAKRIPGDQLNQRGADLIVRAILYDWLHPELTPNQRRLMKEPALPALRQLYASRVAAAGHHPRGLMGTAMKRHCPNPLAWVETCPIGLAGPAWLGEVPDAPAWVEYARRTAIGFLEYFDEEVGKDGDYFEGSTYYYAFMPYFITFLEALRRVTGEDLFASQPWLEKNVDWAVFCSPSGKQMIPFGDSSGAGGVMGSRQATFLYLLARRFQHSAAQFAADQQAQASLEWWAEERRPPSRETTGPQADFAVWADLWRDRDLVPQRPAAQIEPPATTNALTRHFRGCGWGVMREGCEDDDLVVAIQGWKTVGHSHGMQGHFVVGTKGEFVIMDPGYVLHNPGHSAGWHNLLRVDGQEQFDWDTEHCQGSPIGCLRLVASGLRLRPLRRRSYDVLPRPAELLPASPSLSPATYHRGD